jgi:ribosomal-protein-alanine N-acetyltransferase
MIFHPISLANVPDLMPIENACHSHPWSEKTFISCIGGRYFGDYANVENNEVASAATSIGFHIGMYVAGEASLLDICVAPEHQGKGYGKLLLQHFIAQSKQLGAQQVLLEVRASNISAQMMYINTGFIEISRRTGYYPKAIGYEDAIVMSLRL